MWKNSNGGTCVDQKLLIGNRVLEEDEAAEGVELSIAYRRLYRRSTWVR
jgi:hypothetical protein